MFLPRKVAYVFIREFSLNRSVSSEWLFLIFFILNVTNAFLRCLGADEIDIDGS